MQIFTATINQMIFLFGFIVIGFIIRKFNAVPSGSAGILAKLENNIFIPALVLNTFITNFTVSTLKTAWKVLLFSIIVEFIVIPVSVLLCKTLAKDEYTQKIYTYGLCFSNFGFMGNAVAAALFPEHFTTYLIFTLVLWSCIYLYGIPSLLLPSDKKGNLKSAFKNFLNPMIISVFIGMGLGILLSSFDLALPKSVMDIISKSADCMSPVAMLLTGITIAEMDLKKILKKLSIYFVTAYRLLVYPLVGLGIFSLLKVLNVSVDSTYIICTICTLAMPLGLNTIVVPSAYGKDTSVAAGMALVSHILSVATIPIIFMLLNLIL